MRKDWEFKKLSDQSILKIIDGDRGNNYPKKSDFFSEGFCLFLNTKNVRPDGFSFDTTMFITEEKDKALRKGKLKRNDIVMTTRGTIGNVGIYNDDVDYDNIRINSGMLIFRPNVDVILPKYLFEVLRCDMIKSQIKKYVSGAAQPQLPIRTLVNFYFPLPPISEQQEIVEILDEALEGIATIKANTQRNLQNACELFQSYLQGIFSNPGDDWEVKKLGDVCNLITDGTHKTPTYLSSGIPFLSVKNLTQGIVDFSDTRFISIEEHKFLTKRCKPEREDILYTKVGTTGVAKVIDIDREFSIFVSVALLKIKHELIFNRYLEYFLNSPFARQQAKKRTRGMANKNLVIRDIKEIQIYFPYSLSEQQQIVEKLDALSAETKRLELIYQQKLNDLEELKKSILQKAFNGELTNNNSIEIV